jgi:CHAT domain-containing protein
LGSATLATLLLGYNSSVNLSIGASVEALVQGVVDANARFYQTTRLDIRVGRLEIVELYLDTAITAVYALRQLSRKLGPQAEAAGTLLVCRTELQRDDSARQRLFDDRAMSYWPRLIVTDADRRDDLCPPKCFLPNCTPGCCDDPCKDRDEDADRSQPRAPIADRLRYLYVGARARAESVVQQRQPGLIETLMKQQIHINRYQEDIGRMLFQLMVPHDFKDAARQLDRLVLVVDSYTANLPWELMLADDPTGRSEDKRPLALRTAVVRQFASSSFRRQVRQSVGRTALVIGNPSVEGFGRAFPGPKGEQREDPPALVDAQAEAEAIRLTLNGLGYVVTPAIEDEPRAIDVLAKLYRQPYRILHISAHGIFAVRHRDGRLRSGVVLSDGVLITAAEISAMESVPELVFLNCCHLGTVDRPIGRGANKLAASVARELIDIGVRCVIVAGWAVDDAKASIFGRTFYEELLLRRHNFGDSVFQARRAVWNVDVDDITWGAFHAYGEPGWMAEPRGDGSGATGDGQGFVSPDELFDALARVRAALSRKTVYQTESSLMAQAEQVRQLIDSRTPPAWRSLPEVQSALGATWRQLGQPDKAHAALLAAIQAAGDLGRVPVKDIEQLAEVEALLGDRIVKNDPTGGSDAQGLRYIDLAISRLNRLGEIVSGKVEGESESLATDSSPERLALIGNAWKSKAGLYARQLLRPSLDANEAADIGEKMDHALVRSVDAYRSAEEKVGAGCLNAYLTLIRLEVDLLTDWASPGQKESAIALAQRCRQAAAQEPLDGPTVREAAIQADALLIERLLDGGFGAADADACTVAFDEVANAYGGALSSLTVTPSELESIVTQVELLARFFDAKAVAKRDDVMRRTAAQLRKLAAELNPGRGCDGGTVDG